MRKNEDDDHNPAEILRSSASMLVFGLFILAYLIAIDHADWFQLRPASGTATAMSYATDTAHRVR